MSENITKYLLNTGEYSYLKSSLKDYIELLRETMLDHEEFIDSQSKSLSRILSKIEFFVKEVSGE